MENVNSYNYWVQVTVIGAGLDWGKLKAPPTQAVERPPAPADQALGAVVLWVFPEDLIFLLKTTVAPEPLQASTVLITILLKETLGQRYRNL